MRRKKSVPKTVGSTLKNIREKHGYSADELALLIGSTAEIIDSWESDMCEPTITECLILSKLYAIPLSDMFCTVAVLPSQSDTTAFDRVAAINRMTKRWFD